MTAADLREHQMSTHGEIKCTCKARGDDPHSDNCPRSLFANDLVPGKVIEKVGAEILKAERMTVPELEYDLILRGMKSRGEILDYRYQGVSLAWGENPKTGKLMRYKCDFWVWNKATLNLTVLPITIVETKGPRIWPKDLIRFRGCRAEWPMFSFELHQRDKDGGWHRLE